MGCISNACLAGSVDIERVFREHKIVVATNYQVDKLTKAFLGWGLPQPMAIMTMADFATQRDGIKGWGGDTLFLIDRSAALSDAEKTALSPAVAIASGGEVLTLVSKRSVGAKKKYGNAWVFEISAPKGKWLDKELAIFPKLLKTKVDDKAPTVLHQYVVIHMAVIASEAREVLQEWVECQFDPNKSAVECDYYPLGTDVPELEAGTNILVLLDRTKGSAVDQKTIDLMPDYAKKWWKTPESYREMLACRQFDSEGKTWRAALIFPASRLVKQALSRCRTVEQIPEQPSRVPFYDLRNYAGLNIFVRQADQADIAKSLYGDLSRKAAEGFGPSSPLGFECTMLDDLKILNLFPREAQDLSAEDVKNLRGQLKGAKGVAIIAVSALNSETTYSQNEPVCETPVYPAFAEARPQEPGNEPHPGDRDLFRNLVYGDPTDGTNPKYIRAHNEWVEKKNAYPGKLAAWESRAREYEESRKHHQMTWQVSTQAKEEVDISGNLIIYDLADNGDLVGKIVYQSVMRGSAASDRPHESDRQIVRGEGVKPIGLAAPTPANRVSDNTLFAEAISDCTRQMTESMLNTCLLPTDGTPPEITANSSTGGSATADKPEPKPIMVTASATGTVACEAKPTEAELDGILAKCKADALAKIKAQVPESGRETDAQITARMERVGQKYDSAKKQYWATYEYEYEVKGK